MDDTCWRLVNEVTTLRTGGSPEKPRLHKPLLVLLLLARYIRTSSINATFADVEQDLSRLIQKYAPSSSAPRPVYPFWRLQTDGFWQISGANDVELNNSGDPSPRSLTREHLGSWTPRAVEELKDGRAEELAQAVLARYFAPLDHKNIRLDLGLALPNSAR